MPFVKTWYGGMVPHMILTWVVWRAVCVKKNRMRGRGYFYPLELNISKTTSRCLLLSDAAWEQQFSFFIRCQPYGGMLLVPHGTYIPLPPRMVWYQLDFATSYILTSIAQHSTQTTVRRTHLNRTSRRKSDESPKSPPTCAEQTIDGRRLFETHATVTCSTGKFP